MNTADKSIALIDVALRRRFGFLELLPQPKLLKDNLVVNGKMINLQKILELLNKRISVLVDRDHQIGHSYLMNVDKDEQGNQVTDERIIQNLKFRFYYEIIPLLQEYFYNDWVRLKQVIGPFVEEKITFDQAVKVAEDANQGVYEVAELSDEEFLTALSELQNE